MAWDVNVINFSVSNSLHFGSSRRNTTSNLRITVTHWVFFSKLSAGFALGILRLWQHRCHYLRCHSNNRCKKRNYSRLGNRTRNRWNHWWWTWRATSCPRRNTWTHCSPKQKNIGTHSAHISRFLLKGFLRNFNNSPYGCSARRTLRGNFYLTSVFKTK